MAILIDPPFWPAHDTVWSHLVSDASYDELHGFAARLGLPRRSFDLDHYDVPEARHAHAIELGAIAVTSRDVVHRLRDSGLRVRQLDRESARPIWRRQFLQSEWSSLGARTGAGRDSLTRDSWEALGAELITRWNEAHRSYHDERHLEDVLLALDHLATRGERVAPETFLAAWFHDAIYTGAAGTDERDSARLATHRLTALGLDPALTEHVSKLIEATSPGFTHTSTPDPLAHLLDADLSIFASSDARYLQYAAAVRAEYIHVPQPKFHEGRAIILENYLARPTIYLTPASQQLWEARARINVTREIEELRRALH